MSIKNRLAAFIDWVKTEPVLIAWVLGIIGTVALHFGIDLSAIHTEYLGIAATAVAAWAARQQVAPWKPPVDVQGIIDAAYAAGKGKQAKPTP